MKIEIRSVTILDSKDLWSWRNDELTRKMSINTDPVGWETHSAWFDSSMSNPNRVLYIGEMNQHEKIGMCRFEIDPLSGLAEVSINLNPNYRSKNLSSRFLSSCIEEFSKHRSMGISATVKKENMASVKCFEKCGFELVRSDDCCNYYRK